MADFSPYVISLGGVDYPTKYSGLLTYLGNLHTALDAADAARALKAGDTYTGAHNFTGATVTVAAPTSAAHPVTKLYADGLSFATALPAQTGNGGKFVTTDGTTASWASPLPDQTGAAGKVLGSDGTSAAWVSGTPDFILQSFGLT